MILYNKVGNSEEAVGLGEKLKVILLNPSRKIKQAVPYTYVVFREDIRTGDRNSGVITIYIVFKNHKNG